MNAPRLLVALLLTAGLGACSSQQRAGAAIQGALVAGEQACAQLLLHPEIPRDESANEYCIRLLNGCHDVESPK